MVSHQDVTDVIAWQLAHKLNLRVDLFLLSPDFRHNFTSVDRLSEAARSSTRLIADGFAGDRRSFADRVRVARVSQAQVLAHLHEAYDQRLITLDELQIIERLAKRAMNAARELIKRIEADGAATSSARSRNRMPMPRDPISWDPTIPSGRYRSAPRAAR